MKKKPDYLLLISGTCGLFFLAAVIFCAYLYRSSREAVASDLLSVSVSSVSEGECISENAVAEESLSPATVSYTLSHAAEEIPENDPSEPQPLAPESIRYYQYGYGGSVYNDAAFEICGSDLTISIGLLVSHEMMTHARVEFDLPDGTCSFIPENTEETPSYINADGSIDLTSSPTLYLDKNGTHAEYTVHVKHLDLGIPNLYLSTDSGLPIESRYDYVPGGLCINDEESYDLEVRGRGNSSWYMFPQKGYLLKFDERISLFDMSPANKYVLIPNSVDFSLIRNCISMEIASTLDGLEFTPKQIPVNLFLNDRYIGVYTFSEKIDTASEKVDLFSEATELTTNQGVSFFLECGQYIHDSYIPGQDCLRTAHSTLLFFHYPEFDRPYTKEYQAIQDYLNELDRSLVTKRNIEDYIDMDSWADWFIMMELSCNMDSAFWRSTFFYKRPDDKVVLGPIWDFDTAYGNFYPSTVYTVWSSAEAGYSQNYYMGHLYRYDPFMCLVRDRWDARRDTFYDTVMNTIDHYAELVEPSRVYHNAVTHCHTSSYNVDLVRRFVQQRLDWIDESLHAENFNRTGPVYLYDNTDANNNDDNTDDNAQQLFDDHMNEMLNELNNQTQETDNANDGQNTDMAQDMTVNPDNTVVDAVPESAPDTELTDNSTVENTVTAGTDAYPSELFPDDTAEDLVFTVTDEIDDKYSSFEQMSSYDADYAIILHFDGAQLDITVGDNAALDPDSAINRINECVAVEDDRIILQKAGTYILTGTLEEGQIVVKAGAHDKLQLVLDNVSLNSSFSAPLLIEEAGDVIITLADDSINTLSDTSLRTDSVKGCIHSNCDLGINGNGTLNIYGNHYNGIHCKDDLVIGGGNININAFNHGFKGNDSIAVYGGRITVYAGSDGMKSDGYIFCKNGFIGITAEDDAFQCDLAWVREDSCGVTARCYDETVNCEAGLIRGREAVVRWM